MRCLAAQRRIGRGLSAAFLRILSGQGIHGTRYIFWESMIDNTIKELYGAMLERA
jgi:hypothetical protein